MRDWFWWTQRGLSGGGSGGGSGGVPAPLTDLPTTWPPHRWRVAIPRRVFAFQPCAGCCDCTSWTDDWRDSEGEVREEVGDNWTVESGTWTFFEQFPHVYVQCSDSGILTTRRRVSVGSIRSDFTTSSRLQSFRDGVKLRIYFDWTDADNCQYVECSTEAATQPVGMTTPAEGVITIKKTVAGETTTLAGPELWLPVHPDNSLLFVQFWDTAVDGEKYVMAGMTGAGYPVNSWCWCRTSFTGSKCGIGGDAAGTFQAAFEKITQTDCVSVGAAGSVMITTDQFWIHQVSQCFYAKPCGMVVNTGEEVTGTWEDIGADTVTLRTDGGILDVTFTLFFRDPYEPRYVVAGWGYAEGSHDFTVDGEQDIAVWNFTLEEWESLPSPANSQALGETLSNPITDDNIDGEGRCAVRIRLRDALYESTETETDVLINYVRGGRNEYPLPSEYQVELGADWPAAIQGTYGVNWDASLLFDGLTGCWAYTSTAGVYPYLEIRMRFQERDPVAGAPDANYEFGRVRMFVRHKTDAFITWDGTAYSSNQSVCGTLNNVAITLESLSTPNEATVYVNSVSS